MKLSIEHSIIKAQLLVSTYLLLEPGTGMSENISNPTLLLPVPALTGLLALEEEVVVVVGRDVGLFCGKGGVV